MPGVVFSRIPLLTTASRRQRIRVHGSSRLQGRHVFRSGLLFFLECCIALLAPILLCLFYGRLHALPFVPTRGPPPHAHAHTLRCMRHVCMCSLDLVNRHSCSLFFLLFLASSDDIHVEVLSFLVVAVVGDAHRLLRVARSAAHVIRLRHWHSMLILSWIWDVSFASFFLFIC